MLSEEVPDVLTRFPDFTGEAMLYVGYTASRDEGTALATFKELLDRSRFAIADEFWKKSARTWRIYPFAAIQDKLQSERNGRNELWSAEGRLLEQLGQSLMAQGLSWRRI